MSKARTKNEAIWALVTASWGQNFADAQPRVTPASASASTCGAHQASASTSSKRDSPPARNGASSTRTSHTAIVQRGTGSPGQNSPSPHSVPSNTPNCANASTAGACTPPLTSSNSTAAAGPAPTPRPDNTTTKASPAFCHRDLARTMLIAHNITQYYGVTS